MSSRSSELQTPRLEELTHPTPWSELLIALLQPGLFDQLSKCDPNGAAVVKRRDAAAFARYMHELQSQGLSPGEEINLADEPPSTWGTEDYDDGSEEELSEEEQREGDNCSICSDDEEETGHDEELIEYEEVPFWLAGLRLDGAPAELQRQLRLRLRTDLELKHELEREEPETVEAILCADSHSFEDFLDSVLDACPVKKSDGAAPVAQRDRNAGTHAPTPRAFMILAWPGTVLLRALWVGDST